MAIAPSPVPTQLVRVSAVLSPISTASPGKMTGWDVIATVLASLIKSGALLGLLLALGPFLTTIAGTPGIAPGVDWIVSGLAGLVTLACDMLRIYTTGPPQGSPYRP